MNIKHHHFLQQLPQDLATLRIEDGHKVLLTNKVVGWDMWVVLLTDMPEQQDRAWRMSIKDYWGIQSLHESRNRWVRNRFKPTFEGAPNPPKSEVLSLF